VPTTLTRGVKGRDVLFVVISDQGRNSPDATQLTQAFFEAGYSVLSADLRGWGETACTRPKKESFAWDDFFAWRALEMGRPLLGMRVHDLLAITHSMTNRYRKIYVVGIRTAGLVALHAAALNDGIAGVAACQTLNSYQDVIDHSPSIEPVSSFVFGALARYDLPDLARLIHPRPVTRASSSAEILRGLNL